MSSEEGSGDKTPVSTPPPAHTPEAAHGRKYTSVNSVGISHDRNARFRRSMEVTKVLRFCMLRVDYVFGTG